MNIQPFIFNWKGQFDQVAATEDQLRSTGLPVVVINSDEQHSRDGWMDLDDDAYFGEQFRQALATFGADVLFHIQGDATYHNWGQLVSDAASAYTEYNWGVYAPDIDYTFHHGSNADLESLACKDEDIRVVSCTDCTCWFIHRDVVCYLKESGINLAISKYGWGFDVLLCAISYLMGRPVLRDYRHTIVHPKGTNYPFAKANEEMHLLFASADEELKRIVSFIRSDKEKLAPYLMKNA